MHENGVQAECSGRSQEATVTWGWGRVSWSPPNPFSVKLALSTGLEDQVGIECMELWGKGFPGRADSVGKGVELESVRCGWGQQAALLVGGWS